VDGNKLRVGNYSFKFSKSREIEGTVKTVTLKRDSLGDFYVFFVCEVEDQASKVTSGKSVGFDFGLKNFLTSQDGEVVKAPEPFKKNLTALKKASKNLSSKKKDSNNRKKARLNLARAYKKVANQRHDFQHKLARKLAASYKSIFVEDLDLKEMQKSWGRKVSDLGFYSFLKILEHHCNKAGSKLVKIPRFFPSSKTCSSCNHVIKELPVKQKYWVCPNCKTKHHRDVNAAKNIFRVGQEMLKPKNPRDRALSLRVEDVSNASAFSLC
jgi:putative transposase